MLVFMLDATLIMDGGRSAALGLMTTLANDERLLPPLGVANDDGTFFRTDLGELVLGVRLGRRKDLRLENTGDLGCLSFFFLGEFADVRSLRSL